MKTQKKKHYNLGKTLFFVVFQPPVGLELCWAGTLLSWDAAGLNLNFFFFFLTLLIPRAWPQAHFLLCPKLHFFTHTSKSHLPHHLNLPYPTTAPATFLDLCCFCDPIPDNSPMLKQLGSSWNFFIWALKDLEIQSMIACISYWRANRNQPKTFGSQKKKTKKNIIL